MGHCTHDEAKPELKAAAQQRIALDELERQDIVTHAAKGYQGTTEAEVPLQGENKTGTAERNQPQVLQAPYSVRARTPSSRRGRSPEAPLLPSPPGNSPRPLTYCNSARHNRLGNSSALPSCAPQGPRANDATKVSEMASPSRGTG